MSLLGSASASALVEKPFVVAQFDAIVRGIALFESIKSPLALRSNIDCFEFTHLFSTYIQNPSDH